MFGHPGYQRFFVDAKFGVRMPPRQKERKGCLHQEDAAYVHGKDPSGSMLVSGRSHREFALDRNSTPGFIRN
jgi:hypothetical protein